MKMTLSTQEYQDRLDAKRDRFEELADKADKRSIELYEQSNDTVSGIPFGQPILVGHHSESKHRNAIAKSWGKMDKSVAESEKASYYKGKANNVGNNGIQSDDPDAADKLQAKIDKAVKNQDIYKAVNKIVKSKKLSDDEKVDKMVNDLGYKEESARTILEPDHCGRIGFPAYMLTNNNANIKRLQGRIKQLEKARSIEIDDHFPKGEHAYISDDDKIVIEFGYKPDEATRTILKSNAFKWSSYRTAWVRKLTGNAAGSYNRYVKPILEAKSA